MKIILTHLFLFSFVLFVRQVSATPIEDALQKAFAEYFFQVDQKMDVDFKLQFDSHGLPIQIRMWHTLHKNYATTLTLNWQKIFEEGPVPLFLLESMRTNSGRTLNLKEKNNAFTGELPTYGMPITDAQMLLTYAGWTNYSNEIVTEITKFIDSELRNLTASFPGAFSSELPIGERPGSFFDSLAMLRLDNQTMFGGILLGAAIAVHGVIRFFTSDYLPDLGINWSGLYESGAGVGVIIYPVISSLVSDHLKISINPLHLGPYLQTRAEINRYDAQLRTVLRDFLKPVMISGIEVSIVYGSLETTAADAHFVPQKAGKPRGGVTPEPFGNICVEPSGGGLAPLRVNATTANAPKKVAFSINRRAVYEALQLSQGRDDIREVAIPALGLDRLSALRSAYAILRGVREFADEVKAENKITKVKIVISRKAALEMSDDERNLLTHFQNSLELDLYRDYLPPDVACRLTVEE